MSWVGQRQTIFAAAGFSYDTPALASGQVEEHFAQSQWMGALARSAIVVPVSHFDSASLRKMFRLMLLGV